MIFRTQDEIKRKLNKMEPPTNLKFNIDSLSIIQEDAMFHLSKNQFKDIQRISFESGYKAAIKEMKEYFNIKANGVHAKYEE